LAKQLRFRVLLRKSSLIPFKEYSKKHEEQQPNQLIFGVIFVFKKTGRPAEAGEAENLFRLTNLKSIQQ